MISWILLCLAAFFLFIGYMIKFKLTTGLDHEQPANSSMNKSKEMATWLGTQWIFLGIFGMITSLIGFVMEEFRIKLMQAFLIMAVIIILRIQRGTKKFQ